MLLVQDVCTCYSLFQEFYTLSSCIPPLFKYFLLREAFLGKLNPHLQSFPLSVLLSVFILFIGSIPPLEHQSVRAGIFVCVPGNSRSRKVLGSFCRNPGDIWWLGRSNEGDEKWTGYELDVGTIWAKGESRLFLKLLAQIELEVGKGVGEPAWEYVEQ